MLNKIKRIGLSSILIMLITLSFGLLASVRIISDYSSDIKNSNSNIADCMLSFSKDYETYITNGRFINQMCYLLSGINLSSQVVMGEDNWMFYSSDNDGDSIADYEGTNSYSKEQLDNSLKNMLNTQNTLKAKGIEFCLIVPPNKENIYYQYMPKKYNKAEKTRTDTLLEHLTENGVNAINPKNQLIELSHDYKTYYKYDTHWNELGAYMGTKCVLNSFGLDDLTIDESLIETDTKSNSDLIDIADLKGVFESDFGMTTSNTLHDSEIVSTTDERELYHIYNENAKLDKTVFIVGDSFREAMAPNLGYVFKNVYVVHRDNYSTSMIDEINPDYLILEFVERYSEYISRFETVKK